MSVGQLSTDIFSIATILAQALVVVVVVSILLKKDQFFAKHAISFAFWAALLATAGSLIYSEVVGFEPCKLCWFQRVLMYPQVIVLGLALKGKQSIAVAQSLVLSLVGVVLAAYHYLLQIGVAPGIGCDAVGYSVSCSQRFALEYGYITIPMMSLTFFVLIAALMISRKLSK